jgi:methyltransferase (TIGR00027 family)
MKRKEENMAEEKFNRSAEGVAGFRAIEYMKPESERICNDPYARGFLGGGLMFPLLKWMANSGLYDRLAPGAIAFICGRERYIDDFLKDCLSQGFKQIVILGAGFDTRAYRIPGIERTHIFEIDQAVTQQVKLERLKKSIDPLPANVSFVAVDFNTQTLDERLRSSGYIEHDKTLFIWQGVTYFLTAAGVEDTLAFIAGHSGAGSAVIFDYIFNEALHDTKNSFGKSLQQAGKVSGETYLFGIDQGEIEPFLTERGFTDVVDMSLESIKEKYFTGSNAGRVMASGLAIVSARVKKSGV